MRLLVGTNSFTCVYVKVMMSCRLYPPIHEGLILDHVFKEGSILARLYLEESTTHTGQQDNGVTYGPTNGVFVSYYPLSPQNLIEDLILAQALATFSFL